MSEINLQGYMSSAIRRIMAKAYRNVLSNPREAKTVFRLQNTFIKSESRRKAVAKGSGVEARGIKVSDKSFTCKGSMGPVYSGHPNAEDIERFRTFVKEVVEK